MESTAAASGPSDRVRIAEVAHGAALATPGVVRLDAGAAGLITTVGGGARVRGVTSTVAPEGGYDLALRLVCAPVALHPLADAVRAAVQAATRRAGLIAATVSIEIVDVELPGSPAA